MWLMMHQNTHTADTAGRRSDGWQVDALYTLYMGGGGGGSLRDGHYVHPSSIHPSIYPPIHPSAC